MNTWPEVDPELLSTLPPVLRAVVRALGFQRAKDWLHLYGGININIPKQLERALDLEPDELARLREVLARHMDAAGRLWMPKADKLLRITRNQFIQRRKAVESIREQSRLYGLSSRMITIIRTEMDEEKEQLDLF